MKSDKSKKESKQESKTPNQTKTQKWPLSFQSPKAALGHQVFFVSNPKTISNPKNHSKPQFLTKPHDHE